MRAATCAVAAAGIALGAVSWCSPSTALAAASPTADGDLEISNGIVKATISGTGLGLTKLEEETETAASSPLVLGFTAESWQVNVSSVATSASGGASSSSQLLSPSSCSSFSAASSGNSSATYTYECAQTILPSPPARTLPVLFRVVATYELAAGARWVFHFRHCNWSSCVSGSDPTNSTPAL